MQALLFSKRSAELQHALSAAAQGRFCVDPAI
jgi:hypothetical protein